jgi:hypothetical protein
MQINPTEKFLARTLAVGSGFTTIFIVGGSVTDPVNVTKLLSLGVFASVAFGLLVVGGLATSVKNSKMIWIVCALFLLFGLLSVVNSESPLSQGIYGSYGRNNGLLAYVFLTLALLATVSLRTIESIKKIVHWLLIAGAVNVVYCLWVISFGDFVGWNNPYGNILGTLGNPNFIGSFLGIVFAAFLAYSLGNATPNWFKFSALVILPVTAFEIYDSNAIQGRVVGLTGMAIVGFFLLRSRFKPLIVWLYLAAAGIVGFLAALGALQIGPLTSIIYKTSVSLRGQYWLAGWNTGEASPFTGVGMDAFGDWYRRARDPRALELPGVSTVVNAAHNVPLDMFAFGGWPLFLCYLLAMASGAYALIRCAKRSKSYDPVLVVLATSWFGYQLQSIISINQIGLAVWGWVLTGAAISYERITRDKFLPQEKEPGKRNTNKQSVNLTDFYPKYVVFSGIFGLIGLMLALPPFTADSKWRSAQLARTVLALEESMSTSYFNPPNTTKYLSNIQVFEESNLPELAHKYALIAVNWNPEAFELWKVLYLIRNSTPEEKQLALKNMNRLDPLNPDVTSLK